MTKVIKKDGRRVDFDANKLRRSIQAAAQEAKIPAGRAKQVVQQVASKTIDMAQKQPQIESRVLRENILGQLDSLEPAVSKAWRAYDQVKGQAKAAVRK